MNWRYEIIASIITKIIVIIIILSITNQKPSFKINKLKIIKKSTH